METSDNVPLARSSAVFLSASDGKVKKRLLQLEVEQKELQNKKVRLEILKLENELKVNE